jgi:hypothetical protein
VANKYLVIVDSTKDIQTSFSLWGKGRVTRELEDLIVGMGQGSHSGALDVQRDPAGAVGVLTISGGAGAVGATIGGRLVTAVWATSDVNSCDLVAAAINADTTANLFVSAVARTATGTVTIAAGSGVVGAFINGKLISVTWATTDTATATALAAAINADSTLPVVATSSAGVVTLYARTGGTTGNAVAVSPSGTGVTASGSGLLTGGGTNANVILTALTPGSVGSGITSVASGTGVTLNTGARLIGGAGAPGNSFTV